MDVVQWFLLVLIVVLFLAIIDGLVKENSSAISIFLCFLFLICFGISFGMSFVV